MARLHPAPSTQVLGSWTLEDARGRGIQGDPVGSAGADLLDRTRPWFVENLGWVCWFSSCEIICSKFRMDLLLFVGLVPVKCVNKIHGLRRILVSRVWCCLVYVLCGMFILGLLCVFPMWHVVRMFWRTKFVCALTSFLSNCVIE